MIKNVGVLLILFSCTIFLVGQEICDNGIDDDGNGLIDFNDPLCGCSIIPNPSFEDNYACPTAANQVNLLHNWIAAHRTPDYYNTCGFSMPMINGNSPIPLPNGGNGYIGFSYSVLNPEYAGVCLNFPLLAGQQYTLKVWVARSSGSTQVDLGLFGTPNCNDMPWPGTSCPVGIGNWTELDHTIVNLGSSNTVYSWHMCQFTFTPNTNISAITLGGRCNYNGPGGYLLIDDIEIIPDSTNGFITKTGNFCDSNLILTAHPNAINSTIQWYLNGIALLGETNQTLNTALYGNGTFSYVASYLVGCEQAEYTVDSSSILPIFSFTNTCFGDTVVFNNSTTISSGTITDYTWDFGDNSTTDTNQNPTHIYQQPGNYNVTLQATSDSNCKESTTSTITIHSIPNANFSYNIACENTPINFNNLSSPLLNSNWYWDFDGDGVIDNTNMNPTHTFSNYGNNYPVTLLILDSNNCKNDTTINIHINPNPEVSLLNDTTLCNNDSVLLDVFQPNATYLWYDGATTSQHYASQSGSYWVIIELNNCYASDTVNIKSENISLFLGNDTTVCNDELFYIDLSNFSGNFEWSDNSTNSFLNIDNSGTYWVKLYNHCGLTTDTISVTLRDCNCSPFIPNSFTPNNDGINDSFLPIFSCNPIDYELRIFNRWGEELYKTNDINQPWEGKYKGKIIQQGVYIYQLKYQTSNYNKEKIVGSVTLIE